MAGAWDVVGDVLGLGGPSGNDHGSSNWAAWGHQEIRSMLDISVDPGDIGDAARAWSDQARNDADIVIGLTRDLQQIASGGWRGASAEAAIAALGPINDWAVSRAETADHTTALMDASGFSAGQAKATVPPATSHDWGQSLRSFAVGGVLGVAIDAVAQDQAQSEAHAEAVRIMNNVYSAPINDHRTEVPIYPQLADPTLLPPEPSPSVGPTPGAGQPGGGASAPGGGVAGGHVPQTQLTAAHLQGVASDGGAGSADPSGGSVVPGQTTGPRQLSGGQVAAGAAAAAASVPIMAPIAGGGDARQARRAGGGIQPRVGRAVGGHVGSGGRAGGSGHIGSAAEFGPRRSVVAAEAAEGRMGAGLGRGANAAAAGRVGVGDLMAPLGSGRGKDGEDTEHRRPSYLIEMDDVFTDGRKVAPPVIGEDPPEREGRR
jgi:PPE family